MNDNKKSSQVAGTTSEVEIKLLLNAIEQGMQSVLLRDKYLRTLLGVQIVLLILLLIK
ncbi:hypothetical protein SAMN06295926_103382 [Lysinibacillus sp. AC-3]|uniref:hypothetical protein n=1 Tax=unclassified Lysinibacillus TaxID=2636778 RepID=UPI0009D017F5|nr:MULTISPECIES: hypothetical protein [unclassified Lysinibacillus]SKB55366.1 hypothetical protein SAMN06295926_103382 [Lysinibacillus sp. AC-3]